MCAFYCLVEMSSQSKCSLKWLGAWGFINRFSEVRYFPASQMPKALSGVLSLRLVHQALIVHRCLCEEVSLTVWYVSAGFPMHSDTGIQCSRSLDNLKVSEKFSSDPLPFLPKILPLASVESSLKSSTS